MSDAINLSAFQITTLKNLIHATCTYKTELPVGFLLTNPKKDKRASISSRLCHPMRARHVIHTKLSPLQKKNILCQARPMCPWPIARHGQQHGSCHTAFGGPRQPRPLADPASYGEFKWARFQILLATIANNADD